MNTETLDQNPAALWDEVTAERSGKPVKQPEKPAPAPAVAETPPVDPLDAIRAEIAELSKLKDRVRNAEGHIGNLTGSQKEIREYINASKTAANTTNGPSATAINAAAQDPEEWANLRKAFPEWALATEKLVDSRKQNFDARAFEEQLMERVAGETKAVREEIINTSLDAVFPGWKAECASEGFKSWFAGQPKEIQDLGNSSSVGDAVKMLRLYETSKANDPAAKLQAQRQKTLESATSLPKTGRTPNAQKSWEDMTPSERWEYEKKQRAKRNQ